MQKRYTTYVVIPVLLIFISAFAFVNWVKTPAPGQEQKVALDKGEDAGERPKRDPLSVEAYAEKEYSGTDLQLVRVLEENNAYTRHYVTYESGDLTISGIMNVPKGSGPFPVVILNHGYIDPAVYTNGRGLRREQDYFARNGFVAFHPDYRNHAESDDDPNHELTMRYGYVEDVINAVHALRNANLSFIDRDRIGMMGHSMGGGIAQAVMVIQPKLVDAVILYAPVSGDQYKNFERYQSRRPEVGQVILDKYGNYEQNPQFWDEASPSSYYSRVEIPILIHHGTSDADVPFAWSEEAEQKLMAAGKQVRFFRYEGEGHEFSRDWNLFMQRNVEFLRQSV